MKTQFIRGQYTCVCTDDSYNMNSIIDMHVSDIVQSIKLQKIAIITYW